MRVSAIMGHTFRLCHTDSITNLHRHHVFERSGAMVDTWTIAKIRMFINEDCERIHRTQVFKAFWPKCVLFEMGYVFNGNNLGLPTRIRQLLEKLNANYYAYHMF